MLDQLDPMDSLIARKQTLVLYVSRGTPKKEKARGRELYEHAQ